MAAKAVTQTQERASSVKERLLKSAEISAKCADKIAREFVKREKELYNNGIDAEQVLNEIIDSLDSELSDNENIGLALDILNRYARVDLDTESYDFDSEQVDYAIQRYKDLEFLKREFGLSPEEEEEFKALTHFLEKIGKKPVKEEEENWLEIFKPKPVAANALPIECVEIECEVWVPEKVTLRAFKELVQSTKKLLDDIEQVVEL
jgi:hypothetical protein